jgi:hypothetical protein
MCSTVSSSLAGFFRLWLVVCKTVTKEKNKTYGIFTLLDSQKKIKDREKKKGRSVAKLPNAVL